MCENKSFTHTDQNDVTRHAKRIMLLKVLHKHQIEKLEQHHADGYHRVPVTEDEFKDLQELQTWGDEEE